MCIISVLVILTKEENEGRDYTEIMSNFRKNRTDVSETTEGFKTRIPVTERAE